MIISQVCISVYISRIHSSWWEGLFTFSQLGKHETYHTLDPLLPYNHGYPCTRLVASGERFGRKLVRSEEEKTRSVLEKKGWEGQWNVEIYDGMSKFLSRNTKIHPEKLLTPRILIKISRKLANFSEKWRKLETNLEEKTFFSSGEGSVGCTECIQLTFVQLIKWGQESKQNR